MTEENTEDLVMNVDSFNSKPQIKSCSSHLHILPPLGKQVR